MAADTFTEPFSFSFLGSRKSFVPLNNYSKNHWQRVSSSNPYTHNFIIFVLTTLSLIKSNPLDERRWGGRRGTRWILPEGDSPSSNHQHHAGATKVLKVQLNIREKRSSLSPKLQTSTPGPSEAAMYLLPVFDFPALSCLLCFRRTCGCSCSWYRVFIIKFDLCVCFDYCLALTSEAQRPWGICQSPNSGGGTVAAAAVCVCAPCACVCLQRPRSALASAVTMVFPNREGPDQWKSSWSFGKWNEGWLLAKTLEMYDHKRGHASFRLRDQHTEWPNIYPQCPPSLKWSEGNVGRIKVDECKIILISLRLQTQSIIMQYACNHKQCSFFGLHVQTYSSAVCWVSDARWTVVPCMQCRPTHVYTDRDRKLKRKPSRDSLNLNYLPYYASEMVTRSSLNCFKHLGAR